jgi:hypothetical protein
MRSTGFTGGGPASASGAVNWLSLAAAPTFAIMALLTGFSGSGQPDPFCSSAHGSPLTGMVAMYVLMSAFHSAPWLNLIFSRRIQQPGNTFKGANT